MTRGIRIARMFLELWGAAWLLIIAVATVVENLERKANRETLRRVRAGREWTR